MKILTPLEQKKATLIYLDSQEANIDFKKLSKDQAHYFLKKYAEKLNFYLSKEQFIKIAESQSKINREDPAEFIYLVAMDLAVQDDITDETLNNIIGKFR